MFSHAKADGTSELFRIDKELRRLQEQLDQQMQRLQHSVEAAERDYQVGFSHLSVLLHTHDRCNAY